MSISNASLHGFVFQDFADSVGQSEYYSMALSGIGIGDLCGRVSTGLLMTLKASIKFTI